MIPAEIGDVSRTRALMNEAAVSAQKAMEDSDGPFARNLHKTYLESSVKEHLYVSRDEERHSKLPRTCWRGIRFGR